ncbi:MAG: hypothetical protein ACR2OD_07070 [Gaiellaceae bacterium]
MSDAILHESDGLTVVDVAARSWETNSGIPGARMKTLSRHVDGWTEVLLNWLPPDLGGGEPHRHFHRTVRERGLVLGGELPMAEFVTGAPGPGAAVLFRTGFYMDRAPGCVHGLDPRETSQSGFTILEWRDGPGTYLMEEAAAEESVVEQAPADVAALAPDRRAGVVIERADLRLLDSLELPWQPAVDEPYVRLQELTPGEVTIAYASPGSRVRLAGGSRGYVLAGSASLDAGVEVRVGCYLEHRGDAPLGTAGDVGCRVLRF